MLPEEYLKKIFIQPKKSLTNYLKKILLDLWVSYNLLKKNILKKHAHNTVITTFLSRGYDHAAPYRP